MCHLGGGRLVESGCSGAFLYSALYPSLASDSPLKHWTVRRRGEVGTSGEGGLRVGELCTAKRCLTMLCLRQTVQTLLCSSSSHVLPPPPPQYNEYGTTPEEAVCGRNHGQAVINSGLSITRLTVNRSFFQFLCTVERKT